MKPKSASAKRPSASITTKNTAMIRLKKVKTLPATMLATDLLVRSSTGPSLRSLFAASFSERPPGWRCSLIAALLAQRGVSPEPLLEGADRAAPQLAPAEVGELLSSPGGGAPSRDARQPGLPGTQPDRLAAAARDRSPAAVDRVGLG